jgi:signal transduction histidine kinase
MRRATFHTKKGAVTPSISDRSRDVWNASVDTRRSVADERVLAVLVHEMRGPLIAVQGWLMLLQSGDLPSTQFPRALEILARNAERLSELLEGAWDSSPLMALRPEMARTTLDLRPLVQEAVDSLRPEADGATVSVTWARPPRPLMIQGDPDCVVRIVRNLLHNAIKFTPARGRVEVVAVADGEVVDLSISDTGIGIPAEHLEDIFEPFRRGNGTRGRGLGLTIARQLAQMHSGRIQASSRGRNHGATFTLTLPLAAET